MRFKSFITINHNIKTTYDNVYESSEYYAYSLLVKRILQQKVCKTVAHILLFMIKGI